MAGLSPRPARRLRSMRSAPALYLEGMSRMGRENHRRARTATWRSTRNLPRLLPGSGSGACTLTGTDAGTVHVPRSVGRSRPRPPPRERTRTRSRARPRPRLLLPISDAAAGQVVRGQLQLHAIARQDADAELAHLPARVRQDGMLVVQLDAIVAAGQLLADRPFDFDACFLLGHAAPDLRARVFYPTLGPAASTSGEAWSANCLKFSLKSPAR